MITSSPYNTWPLHVKFFTEEATRAWRDAGKDVPDVDLPLGFTTVKELEGVDGKSGERGSGRKGPIDVTDGELYWSLCQSLVLTVTLPREVHVRSSQESR